MSCLVFSHGKESGPWGRKITAMAALVRELGLGGRIGRLSGHGRPRRAGRETGRRVHPAAETPGAGGLEPGRPCLGRRGRPRGAARPFPAGAGLLHAGIRGLYAPGRALPDRHRARLARRHRAGREQHPLGARAPRRAARARLRPSARGSDRSDLRAAARLSRGASASWRGCDSAAGRQLQGRARGRLSAEASRARAGSPAAQVRAAMRERPTAQTPARRSASGDRSLGPRLACASSRRLSPSCSPVRLPMAS